MHKILIILNILIVYNDNDKNYKNLNKNNIRKVFVDIFFINKYIIIDLFILLKKIFSLFILKNNTR